MLGVIITERWKCPWSSWTVTVFPGWLREALFSETDYIVPPGTEAPAEADKVFALCFDLPLCFNSLVEVVEEVEATVPEEATPVIV